MSTIVVFGSSVGLAFLVFLIKAVEVRTGKDSFLQRPLARFDAFAESVSTKLKFRLLQIIQTVRYICIVHIPAVVEREIEKIKESALKELDSRRNMLRGHKDIANKGSVSFFLKKIDESKKNGERGEINESL